MWPNHGMLWGHLVSDSSLEELHAFAARAGIPPRGFDRDHYDVPDQRIEELVALGAQLVSAKELIRACGPRVCACRPGTARPAALQRGATRPRGRRRCSAGRRHSPRRSASTQPPAAVMSAPAAPDSTVQPKPTTQVPSASST